MQNFYIKVRKILDYYFSISIFHVIWALPSVIIIRLLKPYTLIRIGPIRSERIGHFVFDGIEQINRINNQKINTIDWFYLHEISNKQWEKMIRDNLPIYQFTKHLEYWNNLIPGGNSHYRPSSLTDSRDVEGLCWKHNANILEFTRNETEQAKKWLKSKGWCDGDKFICVLVRDDHYLANDPSHGGGSRRSFYNWSYHSYRNSSISTYLPAMEWLAEQGYWVLRMGKLMSEPISSNHPKVIDYAFQQSKNDLLELCGHFSSMKFIIFCVTTILL